MNRRHSVLGVIVLGLAVSLSGCGQTYPVPTLTNESGWCREISYRGVLRGDPDDPRIAWGEISTRNGTITLRQDLVWPPGYAARFSPELEILDAARQVRYVAGDVIGGGCASGYSGGPLYVIEE